MAILNSYVSLSEGNAGNASKAYIYHFKSSMSLA